MSKFNIGHGLAKAHQFAQSIISGISILELLERFKPDIFTFKDKQTHKPLRVVYVFVDGSSTEFFIDNPALIRAHEKDMLENVLKGDTRKCQTIIH